jgi:hypothetical protein
VLRPATLKTINIPFSVYASSIDPFSLTGEATFKIPSSPVAPCSLIVKINNLPANSATFTLLPSNISYSLN